MENEITNYEEPTYLDVTPLPNATAVLVLGIVSIATCCTGVIGLGCGITALVLARKGFNFYNEDPMLYTKNSYNNLNSGKICGIVGICLSALPTLYWLFYFFVMIIYVGILGGVVSSMPWDNF